MKIRLLLLFCWYTLYTYAGFHTVQRGESFESLALLYNVPLDTILKSNVGTECVTGMTVKIPHPLLAYDLGKSTLFRKIRFRYSCNDTKGQRKFESARKGHLKLFRVSEGEKAKMEEITRNNYQEAVSHGNVDALYQLGKIKVHGQFYPYNAKPSFEQIINSNIDDFNEGIEYLQIAALMAGNVNAFVELALACGNESSPIYNPYLCLAMLEQKEEENSGDVSSLICYMYENGYGIKQDLLQAYIHCPSKELIKAEGGKSHRERILESIENMAVNFETAKYGVGIDSNVLMSIGFSKCHDEIITPEGLFWLHRSARMGNGDANWALAGIIQNGNHEKRCVGESNYKDEQVKYFAQKAAEYGKDEAQEYLTALDKREKAKREQERLRAQELERQKEEKKQRRREMLAGIAGVVLQGAAQTYMAIEASKMQSAYSGSYTAPSMNIGQMSDAQWMAKNQLAMQQIAQYTMNKTYADWTGTPMVPTDMSAVDLGTDMSPGSPLWMWGQQQEINRIATITTRMECEHLAFMKRQTQQIEQQIMENPTAPIAGYFDKEGNWISSEMVAAGNYGTSSANNQLDNHNLNSIGTSSLREKNKAYWSERYGNKDCPSCMGSGICKTCNGKRYNENGFGAQGSHECPNCYMINGHASGQCGRCQGKGTIYGLK